MTSLVHRLYFMRYYTKARFSNHFSNLYFGYPETMLVYDLLVIDDSTLIHVRIYWYCDENINYKYESVYSERRQNLIIVSTKITSCKY